jgi:hypothetical protein
MLLIFTVCTTAQLPYARALQESIPDGFIFKIGVINSQYLDNDVIDISKLKIGQWPEMCNCYDEAALVAASKPFFAAYFAEQTACSSIIYFDPTIQIFGSLQPVLDSLKIANVVLTPRLVRQFGKSDYADEKFYLNTGLIDAGFWAMNRTDNTDKLLKWWQKQLITSAHLDLCHAQNHDQLWLMYVPIFYDKVQLIKQIGWNIALHNLHERTLTYQNGQWVVNQTEPLLFFNFRECWVDTKTIKKILLKSGANSLVANYTKRFAGKPTIFSIHQNQNSQVAKWKVWLQNQLHCIIKRIETYSLYH